VTEPLPGSRRTRSGDLLEWTTFGVLAGETNAVPFFIEWSATTRHPSITAPAGCVLEGLEVHDPAASTISGLLAALRVHVPVGAAGRTNIIMNLKCGEKRVAYTTE
jgi:hypothetical protein